MAAIYGAHECLGVIQEKQAEGSIVALPLVFTQNCRSEVEQSQSMQNKLGVNNYIIHVHWTAATYELPRSAMVLLQL